MGLTLEEGMNAGTLYLSRQAVAPDVVQWESPVCSGLHIRGFWSAMYGRCQEIKSENVTWEGLKKDQTPQILSVPGRYLFITAD